MTQDQLPPNLVAQIQQQVEIGLQKQRQWFEQQLQQQVEALVVKNAHELAQYLQQAEDKRHFKVSRPFDGKDRVEGECFLTMLREQKQRNNMNDSDCLASLSSVLTGQAYKWWMVQSLTVKTWENFEYLFRATFGDLRHDGAWLYNMCSDYQNKNEKAAAYLHRISYMASRMKSKLSITLQKSIAYRGLCPEIQIKLSEQDQEDWSDFCIRVVKIELEQFCGMKSGERRFRVRSSSNFKFCQNHGKCRHETFECRSNPQKHPS